MSNQAKLVELEIRERLAILTINNPPVNPLTKDVLAELEKTVDELSTNDDVWALIITGAGEKAFVAGADIRQFPLLKQEDGRKMAQWGQQIFDKIAALKMPVIAAINGFALGGGCELAMACDIRVASENAKLGQPEVNLGVMPGYGGTQRLPRLVGLGKAKELIFSGETIDAAEAYRIGLVDRLVPKGAALEEAIKLAEVILTRAPIAVRLSKEAIDKGWDLPLNEGQQLEAELFGQTMDTEDKNEGATAFLEKRAATFKGK
ncbi:MAG: crotonase [Clostridia bacterium]|jgi:enoyl-CoA hydratase|nr:crotonase [Clostridia bacterium]